MSRLGPRQKPAERTVKTYRVGIVGLGLMGSTLDDEEVRHERWWSRRDPSYSIVRSQLVGPYSIATSCLESDRLELAAGADIVAESRLAFQEKWGIAAVYEDYLEIDREGAARAGGGLHSRHATRRDGSKGGGGRRADLYMSKAMGGSMREADEVLEACRRHGTLFNIGAHRRFDDRCQMMRQAIARGDVGEPMAAVYYRLSALMHGHSLSIDTVSYLLGDPGITAVRGQLIPRDVKIEGDRVERDPRATYEIAFANGVNAWSVGTELWEAEVFGTEGAVKWTIGEERVTFRRAVPSERGYPRWEAAPADAVKPRSAVMACLEDLVEAHETGRPPLGGVEIAHQATEACLAIVESHRRDGAWIPMPLQNRDLYVPHF